MGDVEFHWVTRVFEHSYRVLHLAPQVRPIVGGVQYFFCDNWVESLAYGNDRGYGSGSGCVVTTKQTPQSHP